MSAFDLDIALTVKTDRRQVTLVATDIDLLDLFRQFLAVLVWLMVGGIVKALNLIVGWTDNLPAYYHSVRRALLYWLTPEIGIRPTCI